MLLETTLNEIRPVDAAARRAVGDRLDSLTKPPGSLGRLESLAVELAGMQATERPRAARKLVVVMAADHGVCAEGISAYPQAVTAQMVANFNAGGAAINVLARHAGARVVVVDLGVAGAIPGRGHRDHRIAAGTRNLSHEPAMTPAQARQAVEIGIGLAQAEAAAGLDLLAGGDMGIGNTTASSILTALLTQAASTAVVGPGTGIEGEALARKRSVVAAAVAQQAGWRAEQRDPGLHLLAAVGGFEIAGLAGLMLGAASRGVPFVLDGFITTAAALVAVVICPAVREFLIASHQSAEPGHALALAHLGLQPLLQWQLRLGEGSGAALVFPLLDAACKIVAEMATFAEAGVAGKT